MNNGRRKPRKQIKVSEAMKILGVSRTTVKRLIAERKLKTSQRLPNTTSPHKVFEAEINQIAHEWGIL